MIPPKGVSVGHCRSKGLCNAVLESWPVATIDRPDCSRNAGTEQVCIQRAVGPPGLSNRGQALSVDSADPPSLQLQNPPKISWRSLFMSILTSFNNPQNQTKRKSTLHFLLQPVK